jgi:hypothetical protein
MAIGGIARVGQVQLLQSFVTLGLSALLLGENRSPRSCSAFALAVAYGRLVRPQGQGGVKKTKGRSSLDYNRPFLAKHPCSPSLEVHQIASS